MGVRNGECPTSPCSHHHRPARRAFAPRKTFSDNLLDNELSQAPAHIIASDPTINDNGQVLPRLFVKDSQCCWRSSIMGATSHSTIAPPCMGLSRTKNRSSSRTGPVWTALSEHEAPMTSGEKGSSGSTDGHPVSKAVPCSGACSDHAHGQA